MSKQSKNSRVLRDLIRIGVFSALLIVVEFIIACTVGYIPFVMLTIMPCVLGCVSGIIYIVMLSKLTIHGGILIGSTLFGLCMINMAPYGFMFFTCLAARQKILCKRRQGVVKETGANQRISRVGHNPA